MMTNPANEIGQNKQLKSVKAGGSKATSASSSRAPSVASTAASKAKGKKK